jgi:hypothetical protein
VNKFILGSGVVGLLARHILGPEWKIIPFKRSRFYSYVPALADDYIVVAPGIPEILSELGFLPQTRRYLRAFSYNGQLIFSEQSFVKGMYNQKLFGEDPHPAAGILTKTDFMTFRTSVGDLYGRLLETYMSEVQANTSLYGDVESIEETNHHIKTNKTELDYEKLVSTIPLDALSKYVGRLKTLPAVDVWYYLVKTPALNFEGAFDILVVDKPFDFYKVAHVAPQTYLFHCLADLVNPKAYLGAFLNNNLEVQQTTQIARAIPTGPPPDLNALIDIFPVGCHGQWDMFMDTSSSINRLLKFRNDSK